MLYSNGVISFSERLKNSSTNLRPAREQALWPIWDSENKYYECAHGISWYSEVCEDCIVCPGCGFSFGDDYIVVACPECKWYRRGFRDVSHWAEETMRTFGSDPNEEHLWDMFIYLDEDSE